MDSSLEGWLWFENGKLDKECSGVGMIYKAYYGTIESILKDLYYAYSDYIDDEETLDKILEYKGGVIVDYLISNMVHQDGQMTFPETGQWDFPPYWELDFKILKIKYINGEE